MAFRCTGFMSNNDPGLTNLGLKVYSACLDTRCAVACGASLHPVDMQSLSISSQTSNRGGKRSCAACIADQGDKIKCHVQRYACVDTGPACLKAPYA